MFLEAIASRRVQMGLFMSPEKATIINMSITNPLSPDRKREVTFNPGSITLTASPEFENVKVTDNEGYGYHTYYTGNVAPSLSMELLLDTTIDGDDVREKYIDWLIKLTQPVKKNSTDKQPQPPRCMFSWGDFTDGVHDFEGYLCDLRVTYTYFLPNGRPVRAEVSLTIKQPDDVTPPTNPTSRSEARRVWTVVQGQTLDWIAFQEYGDTSAWRHIARVNNIRNPRALRPGTVLKLTPLPLE
jgi:hypothetical protein